MYRYFCISRPPQEGRPEKVVVKLEGHYELRPYVTCDHQEIYVWGWIDTEEKLPFKEVWNWNLRPNDPVELAHYTFYRYADNNEEEQVFYEEDYRQSYREGKLKPIDHLYWAAEVLDREQNGELE